MTLEELDAACDRAEAFTTKYGGQPTLATAGFSLVVPGERTGNTTRVFPGLMGQVLACNADGNTVVWVTAPKVRKWLAKTRKELADWEADQDAPPA